MNEQAKNDLLNAVDEFKASIKSLVSESGQSSLQMAIAMGNNQIITELSCYELEVRPWAESEGLTAPSLKEIFGFDIKITEREAE